MGLESLTGGSVYIDSLVVTNPTASDNKSEGDDHIRGLKNTIKNTFPNITGAVTPTHTELGYVGGVTSAIQTQLDAKLAASRFPNVNANITASDEEINYADGPNAANKFCLLDSNAKVPFAQRSAFRGALVYNASGFAVSTGSNIVTFDSESYDTDSIHSTSTNTERLTVPSGVTRVRLTANAGFNETTEQLEYIYILKNGSLSYVGYPAINNTNGGTSGPAIILNITSPVLSVTAGDYFTVQVGSASAGALESNRTWFSMEIIE